MRIALARTAVYFGVGLSALFLNSLNQSYRNIFLVDAIFILIYLKAGLSILGLNLTTFMNSVKYPFLGCMSYAIFVYCSLVATGRVFAQTSMVYGLNLIGALLLMCISFIYFKKINTHTF